MENSIFFKSRPNLFGILRRTEQRALHAIDYLILDTATFILLDYTRFTITDTEVPPVTTVPRLYNQVPGAGSVAVADAPDRALYCLVDVLTADSRVLVTIAAPIKSGAVVSVPGTAKGASDGCTE